MRVSALLIAFFIHLTVFSQVANKDTRSKEKKEDPNNSYNADNIDKTLLLKAIEMAGINVFSISLNKFDKKYRFEINLDEYVNGNKINSRNISVSDNNVYNYYKDNKKQIDFIDHIYFFSKDNDSLTILKVETYAGDLGGIKLKKNKTRENQSYHWRTYSKTNWVVDKSIPILIYASSWYDKKYGIDRFCGAVDLSTDESETKKLLQNSPHYYIISYKVSNE